MLEVVSMVERRYQAVREALDSDAAITDAARRYDVDRGCTFQLQVRH